MPGDNLRSISDLQENHRRALAGKLGITTLQALADADQRAIHSALANIRPRPSLTRIAAWQDDARRTLDDAGQGQSAWHTAASFAVIFTQRKAGGTWERRLEAEQTEVEPAAEPRQWPGWDCGPLSEWMLGQLGLPGSQADEASQSDEARQTSDEARQTSVAASGPPGASAGPKRARRAELRITKATMTNASRTLDLIETGNETAAQRQDLSLPVRLRLTVAGAGSGQQVRAAMWFRRAGAPGWSPHEPVTVDPSGQAEFELSSVPPGEHNIRLLAWATDAGATLAAITLPRLTFAP